MSVPLAAVHAAIRGTYPAYQPSIHYTQGPARWDGIVNHRLGPYHFPVYADCSAWFTWLVWQARVRVNGKSGPDVVNGLNWGGGFTGTMLLHGSRHSQGAWSWVPGETAVFYTNAAGEIDHVAMYVGGGKVSSHGHESAPEILNYNYRRPAQARRYYIS